MKRILVDTGPLVALVSKTDGHHAWTRKALKTAIAPLLSVDPVISEALFLLRRAGLDGTGLLDLIDRGAVEVVRFDAQATVALTSLCRKYSDVPMSWADACLVHLSEQVPHAKVMTFDSDFSVYRRFGSQRIPLIRP